MNLQFSKDIGDYKSSSQIVRVMSESWVEREIFCPSCGNRRLSLFANNQPVADLYCSECSEQYELKSKNTSIGDRIVDGAYSTMINRILSAENPNFFLLAYDKSSLEVKDFFVLPKHFFTPDIIEKRKPLSQNARRAGWTGCNILLSRTPASARVYYVENQKIVPATAVRQKWQKTAFLKDESAPDKKGWLIDVMRCVEALEKKEFSLDDVYEYEHDLKQLHPENHHIKDKIRQQLQILRDKGYLEFYARGKYRLTQ